MKKRTNYSLFPFLDSQNVLLLALVAVFAACNNTIKVSEKDANGYTTECSRDKNTKLREGAFTRFNADGKKYEEGTFRKDSLHGEHRFFYENGALQTVENYNNGRYEGVFKAFYEDGKTEQEGLYVNNEMSGEWKTYYKDGVLKETVLFAKGLENGAFKEYFPNGKLKAEGAYFEGENENGELKEYHESGELLRIAQCNKGVCRTTWAADTTKFINRN